MVVWNWVCFAYLGDGRVGRVAVVREIGFVLHFLAVGCWRLAVGLGKLGSFCRFGLARGGNWVRFA